MSNTPEPHTKKSGAQQEASQALSPERPQESSQESSRQDTRSDARELRAGSTAQYRDRPTDDGMKGDGADEPNAGSPKLPRQGPSRRVHQQKP